MEILNKNRRKRAVIRIILIGLLAVSGMVTVVANIHKQYKDQGKTELEQCKADLQKLEYTLKGQIADREVKINALESKIEDLEAILNGPNEAQDIVEQRIQLKDDEIERMQNRQKEIERELSSCKQEIAALKKF